MLFRKWPHKGPSQPTDRVPLQLFNACGSKDSGTSLFSGSRHTFASKYLVSRLKDKTSEQPKEEPCDSDHMSRATTIAARNTVSDKTKRRQAGGLNLWNRYVNTAPPGTLTTVLFYTMTIMVHICANTTKYVIRCQCLPGGGVSGYHQP